MNKIDTLIHNLEVLEKRAKGFGEPSVIQETIELIRDQKNSLKIRLELINITNSQIAEALKNTDRAIALCFLSEKTNQELLHRIESMREDAKAENTCGEDR